MSSFVDAGCQLVDTCCQGNYIEDLPSSGGIFIGSDGPSLPAASLRRIKIVDNTTTGVWAEDAWGINVDMPLVTEDRSPLRSL